MNFDASVLATILLLLKTPKSLTIDANGPLQQGKGVGVSLSISTMR